MARDYYDFPCDWGQKFSSPAAIYRAEEKDIGQSLLKSARFVYEFMPS